MESRCNLLGLLHLVNVFIILLSLSGVNGCHRRFYDYNSFVCVCNSTYCDSIEPLDEMEFGNYTVYTTSKNGHRLAKSRGKLDDLRSPSRYRCSGLFAGTSLCIDFKEYQNIIGFGGSFTDSAGININSLSTLTRQHLMNSYFSKSGLEYNLGRIPIGGTDFSTRPYTYDDDHPNDFTLSRFSLQEEDYKLKIPLILEAQRMISKKLTLVASPWSAPAWMKTNGAINKGGFLKGLPGGLYYQIWSKYFVKFLQEYQKNNITFYGVTAQNEPFDGFIPFFTFNSMGFSPTMQKIFVNKNLGPTLEEADYGDVKIFVLDDNRPFLLPFMTTIMRDPLANKYVGGAALHWYFDNLAPPQVLDLVHKLYKDKVLLMTEVSFLHLLPIGEPVQLGNWDRAETYAQYVIQNLNHWVAGWIDWNLALDLKGGPNWANFNLEGTIIVNQATDEFYKQPIFYIIGHFSKFVPPGSRRIGLQSSFQASLIGLSSIAFISPTNSTITIVILNSANNDVKTDIFIDGLGSHSISIPEKSIQTYVIQIS